MKYSEITDELRARLRRDGDRRLGPEELEAYVSAPISDAERDEVLSLIRWFRRRPLHRS